MENKANRNAILLLGMHRSGTSAATRVFSLLGYDLPKSLMGVNESNQVGHWESDSIVVLNDILLKELGTSWDSWEYVTTDEFPISRKKDILEDISRHLRLEFPGKKDFIVKDPRISRLTNLYLEAFEDNDIKTHVVMSIRNPLAVADSLSKRDDMPKGDAALLWLRYVLDAEYASRGQSRAFFSYEHMLSDSSKTLNKIANFLSLEFPLAIEAVVPQIDAFLNVDLQHHVRTAEDVVFDPIMRGWVDRTYSLLTTLCENPEDEKVLDELDDIRDELDHVSPILQRLQDEAREKQANTHNAELTKRINEVEHSNKTLTQQEQVTKTKITDLIRRAVKAEHSNEVLTQREEETKAKLTELVRQVNEAEHFKKNLDNRIERLINQKTHEKLNNSKIAKEIFSQKSQLAASRKNIEHLEKLTEAKQEQLEVAQNEKAALEKKLEQYIGEASQLTKTLEQKGQELVDKIAQEKDLKRLLNDKEKAETALTQKLKDKEKAKVALVEKLKDKETAEAALIEKLNEKEISEAEFKKRLDVEEKLAKDLKRQLEHENEEVARLRANVSELETIHYYKANEVKTIQSASDELLAKNFDLKVDIQQLEIELQRERRTFFRPLIRRLRSATGRSLRMVLPSTYVDKIAQKVPPNEKQLKLISNDIKSPVSEKSSKDDNAQS